MDHENGRSKRGYEVLEAGVKQPDERRGVGFSSWGGKRNPGKIFGYRKNELLETIQNVSKFVWFFLD